MGILFSIGFESMLVWYTPLESWEYWWHHHAYHNHLFTLFLLHGNTLATQHREVPDLKVRSRPFWKKSASYPHEMDMNHITTISSPPSCFTPTPQSKERLKQSTSNSYETIARFTFFTNSFFVTAKEYKTHSQMLGKVKYGLPAKI